MSEVLGQTARNLLEAALIRKKPVENVGNALWLYVRLLTASNFRGMLSRHIDNLAADLSVTPERIDRWLKRLADAGLIEIQSPAPFLVIKLGMWSDTTPPAADPRPRDTVESYSSYSFLQDQKQKAIAGEDRGVGEGEEALLQEILTTLGEADPEAFRKVLQHYSPDAIRQALERVRSTPLDRVRKNKTALFCYLLGKFTHDAHAPR